MWIVQVIIALCLMLIGFLCGLMAEGMHGNNEEMYKLNRRIQKLERRLQDVSNQ